MIRIDSWGDVDVRFDSDSYESERSLRRLAAAPVVPDIIRAALRRAAAAPARANVVDLARARARRGGGTR